jgi:hypothetical protein
LADCYIAEYENRLIEINHSMSAGEIETILESLLAETEKGDIPKKGFKFSYTSSGGGRLFINRFGTDNPHHGELNAYCQKDTAGYIRINKKKERLKIEVNNKSILYCDARYHGLSSLAPVAELIGKGNPFRRDLIRIELVNDKSNCI